MYSLRDEELNTIYLRVNRTALKTGNKNLIGPFYYDICSHSRNEIKKGGIILDELVHRRICDELKNWFIQHCNMKVVGITPSPIQGPKGNIEFLICAVFYSKIA